jgi:hypothetical protein
MSWSQGNLRWTSPFKSLNNVACRIDIYERNYTGSLVQSVPAASDPFFFEEDNDSDLLNNVLRYRTGYLRLIEEVTGSMSLTEMYPTEPFDRYVEVYYGETLVFTGFIQVQDFSNEVEPTPRVREFPVISALGLMDKLTFNQTLYMPPSMVTLGSLISRVTSTAGMPYERVYLPKNYGYPNSVDLSMKIYSLVVCPWNEDYHQSMGASQGSQVMKGIEYSTFLEGVCKAFGWICHETPTALIFTAFDYEGDYCYFPRAHVGESSYQVDANIPSTAEDLADYFELFDAHAIETTIQPDTGIEINYEGGDDNKLSFQRTYVPATGGIITEPSSQSLDPDEVYSICNLVPVQGVNEFVGAFSALSFDTDDTINIGMCPVAWNGKEGIMISPGAITQDRYLFNVRLYTRLLNRSYYVKMKYDMIGRKSGNIGQLAFNPDMDEHYINGTVTSITDDYVEATFRIHKGGSLDPIQGRPLIFISNIEFELYPDEEPYSKYLYLPLEDSDKIPLNAAISSDVDMLISMYRKSSNLIGTTVRTTKVTEYPYLFQPRKSLEGRFDIVDLPEFAHAMLFSYDSKNWRVIAQRFDPYNDEMTLTMQSSSLL